MAAGFAVAPANEEGEMNWLKINWPWLVMVCLSFGTGIVYALVLKQDSLGTPLPLLGSLCFMLGRMLEWNREEKRK